MKLGLLADIHEHNEHLAVALKVFHQQGVRQVVVLGDIFETGQRIDATVGLLAESHAIGVWGNHDFPFCHAPGQLLRERYSTRFLDFMGRLQPRLEIAGCLFSHVEPWLNPEELADLWYLDGPPDTTEKLTRNLRGCSTLDSFYRSLPSVANCHTGGDSGLAWRLPDPTLPCGSIPDCRWSQLRRVVRDLRYLDPDAHSFPAERPSPRPRRWNCLAKAVDEQNPTGQVASRGLSIAVGRVSGLDCALASYATKCVVGCEEQQDSSSHSNDKSPDGQRTCREPRLDTSSIEQETAREREVAVAADDVEDGETNDAESSDQRENPQDHSSNYLLYWAHWVCERLNRVWTLLSRIGRHFITALWGWFSPSLRGSRGLPLGGRSGHLVSVFSGYVREAGFKLVKEFGW